MNDASGPDAPDTWLTIAEAAARFSVLPRSLRRAVTRYQNAAPNGEKNVVLTRTQTRSTKTGPRSVTTFPADFLSRLAADLRGDNEGEGENIALNANVAPNGDTIAANGDMNTAPTVSERGQERGPDGDAPDAALVTQLQSEVAFLRAALEKEQENTKAEQENTRAALAELSRAREQAQILIAATAAGRLQLVSNETASVGDRENSAQADTQEVSNDFHSAEKAIGTEKRASWWEFWKR